MFLCNGQPHKLHTKFWFAKCDFLTRCGLHEIYAMSQKLIVQGCFCLCDVFEGWGYVIPHRLDRMSVGQMGHFTGQTEHLHGMVAVPKKYPANIIYVSGRQNISFLGKSVFCPLPKTGGFEKGKKKTNVSTNTTFAHQIPENDENDEMAGVTHAKTLCQMPCFCTPHSCLLVFEVRPIPSSTLY